MFRAAVHAFDAARVRHARRRPCDCITEANNVRADADAITRNRLIQLPVVDASLAGRRATLAIAATRLTRWAVRRMSTNTAGAKVVRTQNTIARTRDPVKIRGVVITRPAKAIVVGTFVTVVRTPRKVVARRMGTRTGLALIECADVCVSRAE